MKTMKMIMLALVAATTTASAQPQLKGYDKKNMDTSVKPGADFVQYATGTWLKNHPLDAEHVTNGAFMDLYDQNQLQINELILQYANNPQKPGTLGYKIGTLYNLMMDSVRLNREGYEPLKPNLERIRNVKDRGEYFRLTAELDRRGENTMMFSWGVGADMRNAGHNIVSISQGGLGLGTAEYYLNDDEQSKAVREAYKEYGRKLFKLIGYSDEDAAKKTDAVMAIENRIAKVSYDKVKLRDIDANYHKYAYSELLKEFPGIDWTMMFWVSRCPAFNEVVVEQPEPIHEVEKILAETSLDDLKSYAESRLIGGAASALSDDFRKAYFEFSSKMSGQQQDMPRWKRANGLVNGVLSDAIGQLYCEKYFPES
ncbi:MAG: M13 family peptidase, partial [Prevotella sp.]